MRNVWSEDDAGSASALDSQDKRGSGKIVRIVDTDEADDSESADRNPKELSRSLSGKADNTAAPPRATFSARRPSTGTFLTMGDPVEIEAILSGGRETRDGDRGDSASQRHPTPVGRRPSAMPRDRTTLAVTRTIDEMSQAGTADSEIPDFGVLELSEVIDRVMERLDVYSPISASSGGGGGGGGVGSAGSAGAAAAVTSTESDAATINEEPSSMDETGEPTPAPIPTPAPAPAPTQPIIPPNIDVKLRTQSHIITELGRRISKFQRTIADMTTKLGAAEQERNHLSTECDRLRKMVDSFSEEQFGLGPTRMSADQSQRVSAGLAPPTPQSIRSVRPSVIVPLVTPEASRSVVGEPEMVGAESGAEWDGSETSDEDVEDCEDELFDPFEADDSLDPQKPTNITKGMLRYAAAMIAAKKDYEPPSALGIGLKETTRKDITSRVNPYHHLLKTPYQLRATSYRPPDLTRLAHHASDHAHHLATVLARQTQQLLATHSQDEYTQELHAQLDDMTTALHMCLDALAEEQRAGMRWRSRCERVARRLEAVKRRRRAAVDEEGEAGGGTTSTVGYRRRQYLFNALVPMVRPVSRRRTAERTVSARGVVDVGRGDRIGVPPNSPTPSKRDRKGVQSSRPRYAVDDRPEMVETSLGQ
ncbi:hypothetical protein HK104_003171, partial [Borealophlyctis nickersoniae]